MRHPWFDPGLDQNLFQPEDISQGNQFIHDIIVNNCPMLGHSCLNRLGEKLCERRLQPYVGVRVAKQLIFAAETFSRGDHHLEPVNIAKETQHGNVPAFCPEAHPATVGFRFHIFAVGLDEDRIFVSAKLMS